MKALALVAVLAGLGCALGTESRIETRPDGLWLDFSNCPPQWRLEWTGDLATWEPILESREGWRVGWTNTVIEFRIRSGFEAAFYRVRSVDPAPIQ